MSAQEIKEKYGLSTRRAGDAFKKRFFVKNYCRKQIIINPENFNPAASYNTAWKVYWKNFSWNPIATTIKEDLVQKN